MHPTDHREPSVYRSGGVGRTEGLPQQHRADAVNGPRVQAPAFLARSIGHVMKVALVLSAPVSAPFMGSALRGRHSLPASDLYEASVLVGEWITSLGIMVWALLACVWLIVRLFSSGWHHQRPLHETLTVPALVLYLGAFAPVWPYLILPPFGSSV